MVSLQDHDNEDLARATDDAPIVTEDVEIGDRSKNDDPAIDFPPPFLVPSGNPSNNNNNNNNNTMILMDKDESLSPCLKEELDRDLELAQAKKYVDTDSDVTTVTLDRDNPELAAQTDSDIDDDEALARQLQEEMDRVDPELLAAQTAAYIDEDEVLARRLQEEMDNQDDPELLAAQTYSGIDEDEALARQLQEDMDDREDEELAQPNNSNTINDTDSEEEIARDEELVAQPYSGIDEDEALARRLQGEMDRDRDDPELVQPNTTTNDTDGSDGLLTSSLDEDAFDKRSTSGGEDHAEQARRIEQELNDAEVAQLLGRYERAEGMRIRAAAEQDQHHRSNRKRLFVRRVLPLVCCVGVVLPVVLLFVFGVLGTEDIFGEDWLDTWSDHDGTIKWETNGNGLRLEILNAMDDSWQTVLETAVHNWDDGSPVDPLTLTITPVPYEMNCGAVTGKFKVCNGDYGRTRWRGLNEVELEGNQIVSSVAKMNDYYLNDNSLPDEKLFTMCHEIGHGFGLPHWDEDFFNADLGNCMDYTKNLTANKQPDASNFEFLADLYGSSYQSATNSTAMTGDGSNSTAVTDGILRPPRRRLQSNIVHEEEEGRRILHANHYSELHWKALDGDTAILYYYLLA